MLTNKDIDECLVLAEIDADDRVEAALEEYFRPDIEMEAASLWADIPEPLKQLVRMRAPEAVKRIEELAKGR